MSNKTNPVGCERVREKGDDDDDVAIRMMVVVMRVTMRVTMKVIMMRVTMVMMVM